MAEGLAASMTQRYKVIPEDFLSNNVRQLQGVSYLQSANSNPYLNDLAKEVTYKQLVNEDLPIRDATDQLLIAAQGPKTFTYLSPELTSALRVSNAVRTKDPMRATGVPTKAELKNAVSSNEAMDKLKWKVTGNGLKANAWYNSYGTSN